MAWERKRSRLLCMLSLTFGFFVVEVVVSRMTASLAMLSDSFHMLSDVIALSVALIAARFAEMTKSTTTNTFGWIRAEVMGALVNAVFLTALCFTILLEAVERYTVPHQIDKPWIVIWVGAAGLLVNLLGLLLFHEHGHGHSHSHSHTHREVFKARTGKSPKPGLEGSSEDLSKNIVIERENKKELLSNAKPMIHLNGGVSLEELGENSAAHLNMRGVFLHVLGDALGSVIVVINALIFTYVWQPCPEGAPCHNPCFSHHCPHPMPSNETAASELPSAGPCWVLYLDPTLCVLMVCILLYTTFPLLQESALILLQTVPKQVDMGHLLVRLRSLEGVLAVHELHVWQLAGSRIIATAHIKCHNPEAYMDIAKRVKGMFHDEGIHATTIQPEFGGGVMAEPGVSMCELPCRIQCAPKLCCGTGTEAMAPKAATFRRTPDMRVQYQSPTGTAVTYREGQMAKVELEGDMESAV